MQAVQNYLVSDYYGNYLKQQQYQQHQQHQQHQHQSQVQEASLSQQLNHNNYFQLEMKLEEFINTLRQNKDLYYKIIFNSVETNF